MWKNDADSSKFGKSILSAQRPIIDFAQGLAILTRDWGEGVLKIPVLTFGVPLRHL